MQNIYLIPSIFFIFLVSDNNSGIRMESGPQQILLNGRDHDDNFDENGKEITYLEELG